MLLNNIWGINFLKAKLGNEIDPNSQLYADSLGLDKLLFSYSLHHFLQNISEALVSHLQDNNKPLQSLDKCFDKIALPSSVPYGTEMPGVLQKF